MKMYSKKRMSFWDYQEKPALFQEMISKMSKNPIVFALANPEPEISYKQATSVRNDIIMATGRSDHRTR